MHSEFDFLHSFFSQNDFPIKLIFKQIRKYLEKALLLDAAAVLVHGNVEGGEVAAVVVGEGGRHAQQHAPGEGLVVHLQGG